MEDSPPPFRSASHAVGRQSSKNNLSLPRSTEFNNLPLFWVLQIITGKPQDREDFLEQPRVLRVIASREDDEDEEEGGKNNRKASKKETGLADNWLQHSICICGTVYTGLSAPLLHQRLQLVAF